MDLKFLGITWLESQIQAVNPILILLFIPLFTFIIYPMMDRVFPLTPLRKIGIGMLLMAASFGLTTLIQTWIDAGQRPSIGWQILAFVIITAAEIMVSIVGLEFAYTQAPKAMKSWIMSLFWLSVWGGNQFTAQVNRHIAIPSPAEQQFVEAIGKLPPDWQTSPRNIVLPGYDPANPNDDFVARCQNGRLDTLEIPGRTIYRTAAAAIEARASESFPSTEAGRKLLLDVRDPWDNPLLYDLIDSTHARISSAGPDRVPQTQWDQGLILEKTHAGGQATPDSWLARRKAALGIVEKPSVAGFTRTEFSGGQTKLEGAAYFRFFTWLVLGATAVFIPFAWLYRPKTYLHD
jgi:POT family proton-dependent oligopeptide transporter